MSILPCNSIVSAYTLALLATVYRTLATALDGNGDDGSSLHLIALMFIVGR